MAKLTKDEAEIVGLGVLLAGGCSDHEFLSAVHHAGFRGNQIVRDMLEQILRDRRDEQGQVITADELEYMGLTIQE